MSNLVIQGAEVATADLKALAKLTDGKRIERIGPNAFRIDEAQPHGDVTALCARAQLDHAYVPTGRRLTDFGLAVMDMDSTLISIECIDEIADMQGIKAEVAAITAAAMRGELDYAQSLRRRVQLLAGLDEDALERVYRDRLQLTPGAERLLKGLRAQRIRTLLVSGGFDFFTERLKARLAIDFTCANRLEVVGGKLTGRLLGEIVDAHGKAAELVRIRASLGLTRSQVIGIGDGANDLPFLQESGVSIAFRAKPAVRQATTHCLDYVGLDGVLNLFE
ncbi:MAG: phosphoserine phosphatase SerB [Betaproteobacteria bacterium]|nr:phosphoserine phosphatase SerB [Betaproteobacteria bacterium]